MSGSNQPVTPGIFPPSGLTSISKTLPAYVYQQFSDDDDVQAFFASYNKIAQQYVDWFNNINLPIYTGDVISGVLLDWVGKGIYGYPRPSFATPPTAVGELGQIEVAQVEVAGDMIIALGSTYKANDDEYKRCLTWHLYKGDGFQFNIPWLKRRIHRFLNGNNGAPLHVDETYDVSVVAGTQSFSITLNSTQPTIGAFLAAAINAGGILALPFQYSFQATGS
jgi:hypothetical protein